MALSIVVSPKEMERIAGLAYEGKRVRVSLANLTSQSYTESSSVSNWDSIKVSGNGYTDFTQVIATGAYDSSDGRYEMGGTSGANTYIEAVYSATGSGFTYNRIYVVIATSDGMGGWTESTYLHSLMTENPSMTIATGSTIKYKIQLAVDN